MSSEKNSKEILKKIKKLSLNSDLSVNQLRIIVALESLVARLERHKNLKDKLIFKGGFVLLKSYQSFRFTKDVDASASNILKEDLIKSVSEAILFDIEDGLYFAPFNIKTIAEQGEYGGYRFVIPFQIGALPEDARKVKKLSCVHVDVAIVDSFSIKSMRVELDRLLSSDVSLFWNVYPLESIFAEKLQTLVERESLNSRAKDLYDLAAIYPQIKDKSKLVDVIKSTFKDRNTEIPQSFSKFLSNLDTSVLKIAWESVNLQSIEMQFEECLKKLVEVLGDLDSKV